MGRRVSTASIAPPELFAAYRSCVVVMQLANRFVERGILPADNEFWIANPIVATLEGLMEG